MKCTQLWRSGNLIDFNFIQKLEGYSLTGYVPAFGRSGVTIAGGFDIGQRSENELRLAFDKPLFDKLVHYAHLKRDEAEKKLAEIPLELTAHEAATVNRFSHNQAETRLLADWCGIIPFFDLLSDECQTVIASVAFQYGSLSDRCPNFWHQVTNGEWLSAYDNLRNFGDAYSTRRNKEAALLGSWITKQINK